MAYRDDAEALRTRLSVLERQVQRVPQLEARIEELEAENAALRGPEGTTFTVVLTAVGPKPISCIKTIRTLFSLGLKEAKELVEAAPTAIKQGVAEEEATEIKKALEAIGARVGMVRLEASRAAPGLATTNDETGAVYVDPKVIDYVNEILSATRSMSALSSKDSPILSGARPADASRVVDAARQQAAKEGRGYVTPSDVSVVLGDALAGRVVLSQSAIDQGAKLNDVLSLVLQHVGVP